MGADRAPFGTPRDRMGIGFPVFDSGSRNRYCLSGGCSRRPFDENVRAGRSGSQELEQSDSQTGPRERSRHARKTWHASCTYSHRHRDTGCHREAKRLGTSLFDVTNPALHRLGGGARTAMVCRGPRDASAQKRRESQPLAPARRTGDLRPLQRPRRRPLKTSQRDATTRRPEDREAQESNGRSWSGNGSGRNGSTHGARP